MRVLAAFAFAPLLAAFAFACLDYAYEGSPGHLIDIAWLTCVSALFFGYPAATVLGVPVYLALRDRFAATALNCAVAGAFVASSPMLLLGLPTRSVSEFNFGHVTVEHGSKTLWGWLVLMALVVLVAILGAFGGCVFWVIAAAGSLRNEKAPV